MIAESIFEYVKESFCSLWTIKFHGKTIEIITPFSTTNFKFISVFVTERGEQVIVTDGGWLCGGEYETSLDFEDEVFLKIFNHFENLYEIKTTQRSDGLNYYFKTTNKFELIPNLVNDLCSFLSTIISTSQIQFHDEEENKERENFRKLADSFISGFVNKENLKFRRELSPDYKNVRFNAIITKGNRINLVKYITGSTPNHFINSLTKATVDFEIANNSPFIEYIDHRIAFINNIAPGFDSNKIFRYIQTLEDHTQIPSVLWTEKEKLEALV